MSLPDRRGSQELDEFRLGTGVLVDSDEVAAFGIDEDQLFTAEFTNRHTFRLGALLGRALGRIVAVGHAKVFHLVTAVEQDLALGVPDGEAARTAFVVAFVGGHETLVVDPGNRIRLTLDVFGRTGGITHARLGNRNVFSRSRTGGEMADNFTGGQIDHGDMVVFLQRDDNLVLGVDRNELRLRIGRRDFCKTRQVDNADRVAVGRRAGFVQIEDREMAGRHLRDHAVVQIFVALVLDGDCNELAVRRDGNAVRLTLGVALRGDTKTVESDYGQMAGRIDVVFGRVDAGIGECFADATEVAHHQARCGPSAAGSAGWPH